MPRLHRLFTYPRVVRHSSAVGADLPRDDAVDLDAPDPSLRAALTAAGRGGHLTALSLLADTRERADWHRRNEYVYRLADFAVKRPDWFDDWRREEPENPDAWLVAAELVVLRAWAIRTGARAKDRPARGEAGQAPVVPRGGEGEPGRRRGRSAARADVLTTSAATVRACSRP